MSTLEKNKQYIVSIEGYSSEAYGIARLDGKAVFIPGTLFGEIWEIRIVKVTNTVVYGKGIRCMRAAAAAVRCIWITMRNCASSFRR